MLAFSAADKIATELAGRICTTVPSTEMTPTVIVYDQTSFNNILAYVSFAQSVAIIENDYQNIAADNATPPATPPAPGASAAAAAASGGGGVSVSFSPLSDLTGLVNAVAVASNTENYGSVAVPDSTLATEIAQHIRSRACGGAAAKGTTVVYPPIFGIGSSSGALAQGVIQQMVAELQTAREKAHANVAQNLAKSETMYQNSEQAAQLLDVDGLYDTLINSLVNSNATTGAPGGAAIIQGKAIADLLAPPPGGGTPAYIVLATVIAAGGTAHDHTNIWRKIWLGDQITYSGGLIVEFALWQASSSPMLADVFRYRVPFVEAPTSTGKDAGSSPMAPSF